MIDFPSPATDGQVFSAPNGVVYKYSATYSSWLAQNPTPPLGGTGQVTATGGGYTQSVGADVVIPFGTVTNGNAGGWWNTTTNRYTPPAGSYFMCATVGTQAPTGGNGTWSLYLRKNGVHVPSGGASGSGAASFAIPLTVGTYVDANGTDYFDWVANQASAGMNAQGGQFSAFPLTGIQGPTGQLPAGALSLYSEQVLAAPVSLFQINYPGTARLVEIWFDLVTTTPGTNASINLKAVQNGVPNTGNNYNYGYSVMYNANAFLASQVTNVAVPLVGSGVNTNGVFRLTQPANFRGVGQWAAFDAASTFYNYLLTTLTSGPLTGCNGVQATTSGTFAIGSYLRCLVLP